MHRYTEWHFDIHAQTERQTGRWNYRQIALHTDKEIDRHMQIRRQTDRLGSRQTERRTDTRSTDRRTERQTKGQVNTGVNNLPKISDGFDFGQKKESDNNCPKFLSVQNFTVK